MQQGKSSHSTGTYDKLTMLLKENQFFESLFRNFLVFKTLVEMEQRNGGKNNEYVVEGNDGDDEAESTDDNN